MSIWQNLLHRNLTIQCGLYPGCNIKNAIKMMKLFCCWKNGRRINRIILKRINVLANK